MATGVNQAVLANLRKQIAQLCRDLEEFRIDHVAAIDYDKLTRLTESDNLDAKLKVFEKPPERT